MPMSIACSSAYRGWTLIDMRGRASQSVAVRTAPGRRDGSGVDRELRAVVLTNSNGQTFTTDSGARTRCLRIRTQTSPRTKWSPR